MSQLVIQASHVGKRYRIGEIEQYRALLPAAAAAARPRHADMPYRLLIELMRARLQATLEDLPEGYDSPEEFGGDIDLIRQSLEHNRGIHAGWFSVRRLVWPEGDVTKRAGWPSFSATTLVSCEPPWTRMNRVPSRASSATSAHTASRSIPSEPPTLMTIM